LLDLKKDAIVSIDGQAIVLKTDDFLGIHEKGGREGLHLIAAKANSMSTLTSAFLVYKEASLFVRKYDPQTEELSSQPVDKLTVENLHESLPQLLGTHRVLNYSNIVSDIQSQQWKFQTSYILSSDILRIRSIDSGEKLVPGSAEEDDDTALFSSSAPPTTTQQQQQDGKSISYPPIPVVDSNLSVWQTKHAGTKRYLHQLNPTDRTNLFLNPEHTANQLFQTVLANDYQNSWQAILGDLQLSYTMFLYVQCFSSLEHWKDLVAMLCLVDPKGMQRHKEFYRALVEVLPAQIATIEQGFLEVRVSNRILWMILKSTKLDSIFLNCKLKGYGRSWQQLFTAAPEEIVAKLVQIPCCHERTMGEISKPLKKSISKQFHFSCK
jgi:A1 cistron-splicing factor AAR2